MPTHGFTNTRCDLWYKAFAMIDVPALGAEAPPTGLKNWTRGSAQAIGKKRVKKQVWPHGGTVAAGTRVLLVLRYFSATPAFRLARVPSQSTWNLSAAVK